MAGMTTQPHRSRRIPRSFIRRAVYSVLLVAVVVLLGTICMHLIEGWPYLDSFYFTSMIATGQGPPAGLDPQSPLGKVFASLLAFVSVGTVVSALIFLFGPFFGRVFRLEVEKIEEAEKERERKSEERKS
jgi:ABC-type phosphate transport system permease subunit